MRQTDLELAGKVGEIASHFPQAWQQYQDWLREIVSSRTVLWKRYPTWQAVLIFRWRLLYFSVYVAGVVLFDGFLGMLKGFFHASSALKARLVAVKNAIALWFPSFEQYRYILQRTATLLAVAELTLCGLAALTGILLAFYYQPAAMEAHESLSAIARDIPNGAIVLSLHHIAGQGLIGLALVQIIVMFLGREFLPAWFAGWLSGIALTLTAIGLSWTAIVLDWEQTSFWRFQVELNIVSSIPWAGPILRDILSGGGGINSITLQHMYALHGYVLAIAAVLLSILHLAALVYQEQQWKPLETRFNAAKPGNESTPQGDAPSL